MKKHGQWMRDLVRNTHAASGLILNASREPGTPGWARERLRSACLYMYAAMIYDFVRLAESELIGVGGVIMPDGQVKTSRQFLVESIGDKLMSVQDKHGDEYVKFTEAMKDRAISMLEYERMHR